MIKAKITSGNNNIKVNLEISIEITFWGDGTIKVELTHDINIKCVEIAHYSLIGFGVDYSNGMMNCIKSKVLLFKMGHFN